MSPPFLLRVYTVNRSLLTSTYRCQRDRETEIRIWQADKRPCHLGVMDRSDDVAMTMWSQHHLTDRVASEPFLICVFQAGNRAARWQPSPDRQLFTQHALCRASFSAVVCQALSCYSHHIIMITFMRWTRIKCTAVLYASVFFVCFPAEICKRFGYDHHN